jgi:multiple sugar transport system permease protein
VTDRLPARRSRGRPRVWRTYRGYLFVLPLLMVMLAVVVYPVVYNARVSVFDYTPGRNTWTFVGFANYAKVFQSPIFWQSLRTTLLWVAANVGPAVRHRHGGGRGAAPHPHRPRLPRRAVPGAVDLVVRDRGDPVDVGLPPAAGRAERHPAQARPDRPARRLAGVPDLAFVSLVVANSWKFFPLVMITLLAGLQAIPSDYYEVAEIEGATRLQAFFQVTVPSMLPSISRRWSWPASGPSTPSHCRSS